MDRTLFRWWVLCGLSVVVLAASGCVERPGQDGPPSGNPPQQTPSGEELPPGVVQRLEVSSFSGTSACDDLEDYLQDSAAKEMRTRLDDMRRRGEFGMSVDAGTSGGPASGPSAYTTTNVQTAGVDEADVVKNDGQRIFALSGGTLFASQGWPAQELAVRGRLELGGTPLEMLLDEENRLTVLSMAGVPPVSDGSGGVSSWNQAVRLSVVDVRDLTRPRITQDFYFPGSYVSARRIGSSVRVVLRDSLRYPAGVRWYPELTGVDYRDEALIRAKYEAMKAANEALIRAQPLEAWLPSTRVRTPDGKVVRVSYDCSEFLRSSAVTQGGVLSILTYDLDGPGRVARTALLGEAGTVYASRESLYVASPHWWWYARPGQTTATYLYKFDLRAPDRAPLVASGWVDGTLKDSFSLDEHEGFLRLATQHALYESTVQGGLTWRTTNRVHVLAENAGALTEVGRSPELAPGERIMGARFFGDRGFVVTFRSIDPLFTLDLSDPTQPRVLGELKVPGFSTYLHPVDENHLVGVGQFIPENGNWAERSLQLSLFDVSDLAHPKQQAVLYVGDAYSSSPALSDHRAFTWLPEKKLLALPVMGWDVSCTSDSQCWSSFTSDLRVFSLDTTTGFTARGTVSIADMVREVEPQPQWWWYGYWQPVVRRSVIADDYVYAISTSGIRAAHVSDLTQPVGTALFKTSP